MHIQHAAVTLGLFGIEAQGCEREKISRSSHGDCAGRWSKFRATFDILEEFSMQCVVSSYLHPLQALLAARLLQCDIENQISTILCSFVREQAQAGDLCQFENSLQNAQTTRNSLRLALVSKERHDIHQW